MTYPMNRAAAHHINILAAHGAQLRNPDDGAMIPLTEAFYQKAVANCHEGGYNAVCFDLVLPDIDEELMLAVHRDGHVDSGRVKSVIACLDR